MVSASDRDRRRFPRIDVLSEVGVRVNSRPLPLRLRNIGPWGFAIETEEPFEMGVSYLFEFQFLDSPVEVVAICIHCEPIASRSVPTFFAGFAFETLDDRARRVVRAFIDRRTSAPSPSGR